MDDATLQQLLGIAASVAGGVGSAYSPWVGRGVNTGLDVLGALQNFQARNDAMAARREQEARLGEVLGANNAVLGDTYQSQKSAGDLLPIPPVTPGGPLLAPGRPAPIPVHGDISIPSRIDTPDPSSVVGMFGPQTMAYSDAGTPHGTTRLADLILNPQQNGPGPGDMAPLSWQRARAIGAGNLVNPNQANKEIQSVQDTTLVAPPPTVEEAQKMFSTLMPGAELSGVPVAGGAKLSMRQSYPPTPASDKIPPITTDLLAIRAAGQKTGNPTLDALDAATAKSALALAKPQATGKKHQVRVPDENGQIWNVTYDGDGNEINRVLAGKRPTDPALAAIAGALGLDLGGGAPASGGKPGTTPQKKKFQFVPGKGLVPK